MKFVSAFVLLISFSLSFAFAAEKNTPQTNLYKAHDAYDNGDYQTALEYYNKGYYSFENGKIHYNLGNFNFRNGKLGQAIFHYRKAVKLIPRDADARFNLGHAKKKTIDKIEEVSGKFEMISLNSFLNLKESAYLVGFLSVFFWLFSILLLYRRNEWIKWTQRVFMYFFIIVSIVVAKDYLTDKKNGVVVDQEIKVYSAIGRNNVVLFTIHEGTEFVITNSIEDKWIQLLLTDGKKGWARTSGVIF